MPDDDPPVDTAPLPVAEVIAPPHALFALPLKPPLPPFCVELALEVATGSVPQEKPPMALAPVLLLEFDCVVAVVGLQFSPLLAVLGAGLFADVLLLGVGATLDGAGV